MSEGYDYIIAGAGLAGRSLAYFLSIEKRGPRHRILLIDSPRVYAHRTFSYWTDGGPPLGLSHRPSFTRISISTGSGTRTYSLHSYSVRMTSSREVFDTMDPIIRGNRSLVRITGQVASVRGRRNCADVVLEDGRRFTAGYVFDSRFPLHGRRPKLLMHGEGWHVTAPSPTFEPGTATLFDFRTGTDGDIRFFYVLPRSPLEALVEVTHLSARAKDGIEYGAELTKYLAQVWQLDDFAVTSRESGTIPLGVRPPRSSGRVIPIGTKSGIVKATTGFGFTRILEQAQQICTSVAEGGVPHSAPRARRFSAYDRPVIGMWKHRPAKAAAFMGSTFAAMDADSVLRFLDERTTLTEERAIAGTLPVRALLDPVIWV